jgi:hypothetical protein
VLRPLPQNSAVALVAAAVTGDTATVGLAVLPAMLAQTSDSREFETEADESGFLSAHPVTEERIARARTDPAAVVRQQELDSAKVLPGEFRNRWSAVLKEMTIPNTGEGRWRNDTSPARG